MLRTKCPVSRSEAGRSLLDTQIKIKLELNQQTHLFSYKSGPKGWQRLPTERKSYQLSVGLLGDRQTSPENVPRGFVPPYLVVRVFNGYDVTTAVIHMVWTKCFMGSQGL